MPRPASRALRTTEELLLSNLSRSLVLSIKEALEDADAVGNLEGMKYDQRHRRWITGMAKHCRMNERWHEALLAGGANPTPLRSNVIVEGQGGIFRLARHNMPGHQWKKGVGKKRRLLAELNRNLMVQHVMPDFFKATTEVTTATVFFVAVLDGCDADGQPQVTSVNICIPHPDLSGALYIKSITEFLKLYDIPKRATQLDKAQPTLKTQRRRQKGNDQGN